MLSEQTKDSIKFFMDVDRLMNGHMPEDKRTMFEQDTLMLLRKIAQEEGIEL